MEKAKIQEVAAQIRKYVMEQKVPSYKKFVEICEVREDDDWSFVLEKKKWYFKMYIWATSMTNIR